MPFSPLSPLRALPLTGAGEKLDGPARRLRLPREARKMSSPAHRGLTQYVGEKRAPRLAAQPCTRAFLRINPVPAPAPERLRNSRSQSRAQGRLRRLSAGGGGPAWFSVPGAPPLFHAHAVDPAGCGRGKGTLWGGADGCAQATSSSSHSSKHARLGQGRQQARGNPAGPPSPLPVGA